MAIWIDDECLGTVDNGKAVKWLKVGFDTYKKRIERYYKKIEKGEISFSTFASYEREESQFYKGMIVAYYWLGLLSEKSYNEYYDEIRKISIEYTYKAIDKMIGGD